MGNQVLIDTQLISIDDMLNINIQALTSSWHYTNSNKTPLMLRAWRITQTKHQFLQQLIDFVNQKNIGIGFNRDDAYIVLTILDQKCSLPNMNKIPFYAKMFLDSQNNILEWNKNNSYRRKCDNYVLQTHLIKGKKLSSSNLLKALSTYFKLQNKMKQVDQKFLQALMQGATISNSKLIKRQLALIPQQKVECSLQQIHNFNTKAKSFPLIKQLFLNQKRARFDQLPIEDGINYWYLFHKQAIQQPFQLDITQIKQQNPLDFSDFQNQLQLGIQQNPIISPQLGDMSLSLLNQLKPIIKYQMPNTKPYLGSNLQQNKFYMLCKQKVNGVDVVLWQGKHWNKDQQAMGQFMEKVISQNYGNWPDDKIFMHERGYDLN